MRQYPHRPDTAHLSKNARFVYSGVDQVRGSVAKSGPAGWHNLATASVRVTWQALALAWAEERPLPEVRAYASQAAEWTRQALDADTGPLELHHASGWLWSLVITGDWESARRLAGRIPAELLVDIAANAPIADQITAVARLVDGRDPGPAIESLRNRLADPRIDPELAARLGVEHPVIEAIARQDPAGLSAAFDAYLNWHINYYKAPASNRRNVNALVSMTGLTFAALAIARGLPVPTQSPYLPIVLLVGR